MKKISLTILLIAFVSSVANSQIYYQINLSEMNFMPQKSVISTTNSFDYGAGIKYSFRNTINLGLEYSGLRRSFVIDNTLVNPAQNKLGLAFDWYLFSKQTIRPMGSFGIYSSFINQQNVGYNIGSSAAFSANYTYLDKYYINLGIKTYNDFFNSSSTNEVLQKSYGFYLEWGVNISSLFAKKQN